MKCEDCIKKEYCEVAESLGIIERCPFYEEVESDG